MGSVIRPDGSRDVIELNDNGHLLPGGGDDIDRDGIYTGVYNRTDLKGPYQFLLKAEVDQWRPSEDRYKIDTKLRSPRFVREVRVSTAVGDPNDIELKPDDDVVVKPVQVNWCKWLVGLVLLLILLLIWNILRCRKRN